MRGRLALLSGEAVCAGKRGYENPGGTGYEDSVVVAIGGLRNRIRNRVGDNKR